MGPPLDLSTGACKLFHTRSLRFKRGNSEAILIQLFSGHPHKEIMSALALWGFCFDFSELA